jgi:hypothetical protein
MLLSMVRAKKASKDFSVTVVTMSVALLSWTILIELICHLSKSKWLR